MREDERRLEVWLGHPLHGEIVRAGLGAVRTRTVLRSLADAVEGTGMRRRGDLLRVATWRLESGSKAGVDMLLMAARQAFLVMDYGLPVGWRRRRGTTSPAWRPATCSATCCATWAASPRPTSSSTPPPVWSPTTRTACWSP